MCQMSFSHIVYSYQVIRMVGESQEAVGAGVGSSSSGSNKTPTLEEFGTNLTTQAEEVKIAFTTNDLKSYYPLPMNFIH